MNWRGDLVTRLRSDAALAALLGTRIAWFDAGRSWRQTYPQLVLQEIIPGRAFNHEGADGLDRPLVQFDIYTLSGGEIDAVEAALLALMEQDQVTQGTTRFGFGFLQRRRSLPPSDLADQTRVLRLSMDFTFHHETI